MQSYKGTIVCTSGTGTYVVDVQDDSSHGHQEVFSLASVSNYDGGDPARFGIAVGSQVRIIRYEDEMRIQSL